MTGLDRLRELASGINPRSVWSVTSDEYDNAHGLDIEHKGGQLRDFLADIADQIEAEQEERITRRLEDREAAEWVEQHGGLDAVIERWSGSVPSAHVKMIAAGWEGERERLIAHARGLEQLLGERKRQIERLNSEIESMRPRLSTCIRKACITPRC